MDKRWMGWMLAAGALSMGVGCGPAEDGEETAGSDPAEDVESSELGVGADIGKCRNGMSTAMKKLRPASDFPLNGTVPTTFTCSLGELPELMAYVCATDPKVCDFLNDVLDHNGRLQCTRYVDSSGQAHACADIVDKDPLGELLDGKPNTAHQKNFMVAYTHDKPPTAQIPYWDGQLTLPANLQPPVELSVAGYYATAVAAAGFMIFTRDKPLVTPNRRLRTLKFDPRECSTCGGYWGPNMASVVYPLDLDAGWIPKFTPSDCKFETRRIGSPEGQTFTTLSPIKCNNEAQYRATARW